MFSHETPRTLKNMKQIQQEQALNTPIHYTWIGPPKSTVAGHDVGGPTMMAKANKSNPIFFWCLDEHKKYYQEKFRKHLNITVNSVETYIAEKMKIEDIADAAKKLDTIYRTLLLKKGRGSIRDRVTFKVAFAIFLLQSAGGYTLDTNITPLCEEKFSLPSYKKISVPSLEYPIKEDSDLECWLMYSPSAGNPNAKIMFDTFYSSWINSEDMWEQSEELREKLNQENKPLEEYEKALKNYYDYMGNVVISPIAELHHKKSLGIFNATETKSDCVTIELLKVEKTYFNTHNYKRIQMYNSKENIVFFESKDVEIPNEIFFFIYSENISQLRIFIENEGNVNDTIKSTNNDIFKGETPLHIAIRNKSKRTSEMIKLLLEAGANPDVKVTYPSGEFSSRDLIQKDGNKECLKALKDFDDGQRKKLKFSLG